MFQNHLKVVRCPLLDNPGIIIIGTPLLPHIQAARSPRLLAHDLVEHVNGPKRIGGLVDELEAMGAFWLARACHDAVHLGEKSIAEEWGHLWTCLSEYAIQLPERSREPQDATYNEELDTIEESFLSDCPEADGHPFVKHARAAFKRGAHKARRRYGPGFGAADHFSRVREACASLFQSPLELGDRFTIRWDKQQVVIAAHRTNISEYY